MRRTLYMSAGVACLVFACGVFGSLEARSQGLADGPACQGNGLTSQQGPGSGLGFRQGGRGGGMGFRHAGGGQGGGRGRMMLMRRFDANGDGTLSPDERAQARQFFAQFDTDGDGQVSQEERRAARQSLMGQMGQGMGRRGMGRRFQGTGAQPTPQFQPMAPQLQPTGNQSINPNYTFS